MIFDREIKNKIMSKEIDRFSSVISVLIIIFSIETLFISSADAQTWEEVKNATSLEISREFMTSLRSYRARRSVLNVEDELRLRDYEGVLHVTISGNYQNKKVVSVLVNRINLYENFTNKKIKIHFNEGTEFENLEIRILSQENIVLDIDKETKDGNNFRSIPNDLCARTITYDISGKILRVLVYINESLSGLNLNSCINSSLFHGFYIGDLYYFYKGNRKSEKVSLTSFDFLNLRILYDERIPKTMGELEKINSIEEVGRDAKLWMCNQYNVIICGE